MRRVSRRRVVNTRLRAFTSFSDLFSSTTLKSGWKEISGSWTSGSSALSTFSTTGLISIPMSKSDATISIGVPSGTGVGVYFWGTDSNNYWASYAFSTGSTVSTCTNNACSGTENYTVTQSCSCPFAGYYYPSTCNNGSCSGSEQYTATRSCSCSYVSSSNCNSGACSGSESFTNYRSCSCSTVSLYGYCTYTPGTTTSTSAGCVSAFSGCAPQYTETSAPGICGCPTGSNRMCCVSTTTTSGSWSYNCCSYTGQVCAYGTTNQSTCNSGACSGIEAFTDSRSCSCSVTSSSNCNSGSCSGSENYTASRSCSCPQTAYYSSTCNNGACSGTYSYQASRSCSCTTTYARKLRTVKVVNGTSTLVGEFTISSVPTTIQIITSGTGVSVSASGASASYTNSDGTTNKNFGIIKTNGGSEQVSAISTFSAQVA